MECFELYKMIFYALDNEYDKNQSEELGDFLSGMNPFLFEGIGSAISDIYIEFKKLFKEKFNGKCNSTE